MGKKGKRKSGGKGEGMEFLSEKVEVECAAIRWVVVSIQGAKEHFAAVDESSSGSSSWSKGGSAAAGAATLSWSGG